MALDKRALPPRRPVDTETQADNSRAYRGGPAEEVAMSKRLRCMLGRHHWVRHVNPEVSGKAGIYFVCSRCSKERMAWEPPTEGQVKGLAGGPG
jgi:hypothetical protein